MPPLSRGVTAAFSCHPPRPPPEMSAIGESPDCSPARALPGRRASTGLKVLVFSISVGLPRRDLRPQPAGARQDQGNGDKHPFSCPKNGRKCWIASKYPTSLCTRRCLGHRGSLAPGIKAASPSEFAVCLRVEAPVGQLPHIRAVVLVWFWGFRRPACLDGGADASYTFVFVFLFYARYGQFFCPLSKYGYLRSSPAPVNRGRFLFCLRGSWLPLAIDAGPLSCGYRLMSGARRARFLGPGAPGIVFF